MKESQLSENKRMNAVGLLKYTRRPEEIANILWKKIEKPRVRPLGLQPERT